MERANEQEAEKQPQNASEHVQVVCSELFKRDPGGWVEHTSLSLGERCVQTPDPQSTNGKAKRPASSDPSGSKARRAEQHARRYVESKDAAKRNAGGSDVS